MKNLYENKSAQSRNELRSKELSEESIIVKECQSSVDEVKEEVKNSVDSPKLEKSEEVDVMEEKPEVVVHVQEKPEEVLEVREKILSDDANETPTKEMRKEKTQKLTKKDGNVGINRTRISPKVNTFFKFLKCVLNRESLVLVCKTSLFPSCL